MRAPVPPPGGPSSWGARTPGPTPRTTTAGSSRSTTTGCCERSTRRRAPRSGAFSFRTSTHSVPRRQQVVGPCMWVDRELAARCTPSMKGTESSAGPRTSRTATTARPLSSGRRCTCPTACQQDYAFDRHSGALLCHHDTGCAGGGCKTPLAHGGFLYHRDTGYPDPVSAVLSAQSGSFLHPFAAGPAPAFATHTGFFLSSVNGSPGVLEARPLPFGDVLWTFVGDGGLSSAPIVTGRYVYVGSSSGMLYAVDRSSGQAVWADDVGASILAPDEQNVSQPLTGLAPSRRRPLVPGSHLARPARR